MRVLRKIMAITLALTLVLSMGAMTAFAAETMTQADLEQAIVDAEVDGTVALTGNVTLESPLVITKDVTIDGGGFTIDASEMTTGLTYEEAAGGAGTGKFHAIVVMGTNATLKNLTVIGATGKTQSGYGIHMGDTGKGNRSLTLESVIVKGAAKGGGLFVNEAGTVATITNSTFTDNAWGGIEVAKGCTLKVSDTELTALPNTAMVWIDPNGADVTEDDTNRIDVTMKDGTKLLPTNVSGQVWFTLSPTSTITGIGADGAEGTIVKADKLFEKKGNEVIVPEGSLPKDISTINLKGNGYPNNIRLDISVEQPTEENTLQLIAESEGHYFDVVDIGNYGGAEGFKPVDTTTDLYYAATALGKYTITVKTIDVVTKQELNIATCTLTVVEETPAPETDVTVSTAAEFMAAIETADTIALGDNIELAATPVIRRNITINGKGKILDASKIVTGYPTAGNKHGIVVENASVTLNDVTVSGAMGYGIQISADQTTDKQTLTLNEVQVIGSEKGGLLVNKADTTTNIRDSTFSGNAWGDIEVVPGCTLTVDDSTTLSSATEKIPAIWIEGVTTATLADTIVTIKGYVATDKTKDGKDYVWYVKEAPPAVDKTALETAIEGAKSLEAAVKPSEDGKDIAKTEEWATQANIYTFAMAITAAENVYANADATAEEVSAAVAALAVATTVFEGQVAFGTKDEPVDPEKPTVTLVTVSPDKVTIAVGASSVLEATVKVTGDAATTVTWISSDKNIATVSDGVVQGVKAGKVTITATSTVDSTKKDTAVVTVTSDEPTDPDPKPDPDPDPKPDPKPDRPSGGGGSTPPPSENTANKPETTEKINDTIAALKDPTKELPKEAVKTTTAGGAGITVIPLKLSTGNATLGSDIINTIGSAPATVGLKLTVSNGIAGGSAEIIIPGGFGKITEPGRFSYTMDYKNIAENDSKMIGAVKGDNAVSMTSMVGGNFTLPVTATVTVPTKLANGSSLNIYKYDPITNTFAVIGKAVVKDGKITFATKMMGELLFTTGTL